MSYEDDIEIDEEVREGLRKAAALVEKGWCQNDYALSADGRRVSTHSRSAVRRCAMGAIYYATRLTHKRVHAVRALRAEILRAEDSPGEVRGVIAAWNDAPGRTAEEVRDVMLRAAGDRPRPANPEERT